MSFDVQSMRYVNFEDAGFALPPKAEGVQVRLSGEYLPTDAEQLMEEHFQESLYKYEQLIEAGMEEEDARYVLPLGTKVNLTFSANPRTLMHLIDLRLNGKAQWEIRELSKKILDEAYEWAPLTFEAYEKHARNNSLLAP
jgi:thymidylate synthase (FAD)